VELYSRPEYVPTVSVNVETRVSGPGSDDRLEDAWDLKETIRRSEGVLKQRRSFFADAYRRSTVHLRVERRHASPKEPRRRLGTPSARRVGSLMSPGSSPRSPLPRPRPRASTLPRNVGPDAGRA